MTEAEKKKMRQIAAKLKNPRPEELPSGSWRCERVVNGQRIRATDKDPAVAHAKVNAIAAGIIARQTGTIDITFGEAYESFIAKNENIFSPSTILGYDKIKKNYLNDFVNVPMKNVTESMIQSKVNQLSKKYAPKTVYNIYGLITDVYYDVYEDRRLNINLPQKEKTEIKIPDKDEIKKIYETCKGTKYELPILFAMELGLRASEIRGLKWDDIEGEKIHIKSAIVEGKNGATKKKTKSTDSTRWLYLTPKTKEILASKPKTGEHIVAMSGQAMGKGFSRICKKAGINHYRFHDLRHVFASVSISINMPLEYIRKEMGHKTDHMIKLVYGHIIEEERSEHADRRAEYFSKISENPPTNPPRDSEEP